MFVSGSASISKPSIYVYIICFDKFMPLLFIYQLNSFSTGQKYLLQRNSLPVAIKCPDDQWINSYYKMNLFTTREI